MTGRAPTDASARAAPPVPWQPVEGERDGLVARLEALAVRGLVGGISRLPHGLRDALLGGGARLARRLDRRHTDAARAFLRQALGDELDSARREELVRIAWKHLFDVALASERLFRNPERARFEEDFAPDVYRIRDEGRGALMLSPHLGNWEAATLGIPRAGFAPLYAVARPPKNRPLSRHFQRTREVGGVLLLARHGAGRLLPRILKAGGYVILLPDQRARISPVVAPFFGRPAHCEKGPALMMQRLRVPLVIGACLWTAEPDCFRMVAPTVMWPEDHEGQSLEEVTARVNRAMEALILAHPEQYYWLHDRWYKAPPADGAPAANPNGEPA